jgi:hypothetical protein
VTKSTSIKSLPKVYIKMKNYEDAEEFILRTLAMDGKNVKVACDRENQ